MKITSVTSLLVLFVTAFSSFGVKAAPDQDLSASSVQAESVFTAINIDPNEIVRIKDPAERQKVWNAYNSTKAQTVSPKVVVEPLPPAVEAPRVAYVSPPPALIIPDRPTKSAADIREREVDGVLITYDGNGDWVKLITSGSAPIHDSSAHAVAEATKVASMHAKQSLADFINNDFTSRKTSNTNSTSKIHTGPKDKDSDEIHDNDVQTLTTVMEQIRDNSAAVLRGVYITSRNVTEDAVSIEITATKQSISASHAIRNAMGR